MSEVSFGPFLLDPSSTRLTRDGVDVKLRPQAFQALRTLLRHSGQSIGYEQMMAEAWDGTFVSRHTVDVTIGEVRKSLGEFGRWITHRPKVGYCLEIPASEELVRTGWHYWNRRTREGADRAIDCFKRAARECGTDFRAWEGMSTCYLMLATFGMRAPRDVYPEFLEAHERAVDAGGLRPELRCNRAHGLHMFEHRLGDAEAEFTQTIRERPTYGTAYVRSALMYSTLKRFDKAWPRVRVSLECRTTPQLLEVERADVDDDPEAAARTASERFGGVCVLKGPRTFVASNEAMFLFDDGSPGLGTSGSGDVLAGAIAGLATRGADPLTAALWGVWAHAAAARRAETRLGRLGLLARDLLREIPSVLYG